jgi:hypothetical protein
MTSIAFPNHLWRTVDLFRQTYGCKGKAASSTFYKGPRTGCDFVLLSMSEVPEERVLQAYRHEQRILVVMENPSVWQVPEAILATAGVVISPFNEYRRDRARFFRANPSVPWFYGIHFDNKTSLQHLPLRSVIEFKDIAEMTRPNKQKILSVIVSGKGSHVGYRWRLALAQELKKVFGRDCDIFGFGHNPIPDKSIAIDPYLFTLAIENESRDFYWTEKLADSYLGFAYPIYSGDKRVQDDFQGTISTLVFGMDIKDAVKRIMHIISNHDSDYERSVLENRNAILYEHNLFYMLDRIAGAL